MDERVHRAIEGPKYKLYELSDERAVLHLRITKERNCMLNVDVMYKECELLRIRTIFFSKNING